MRSGPWTTFAVAALAMLLAFGAGELVLRAVGLGDPVLYDNRLAYGYRPLPNQHRRRLGGARVDVNGLGVRGPEVAARRPAGTARLLFLGDSVTWGGSYVDDAELFAARAARRLGAGVEWLDAGVNGWGPENVLGFVRETHGFDSSVWIVTALEDDLRREKTHAGEVPYFDVAPRTAWEELFVLGAYRILTAYKRPKPDADLVRLADANLGRYAEIVGEARAAAARVLLVWHPTADAVDRPDDPHRDRFLALATGADAAALDLGPAYRRAGREVYVDGMHLSVSGHTVAGAAIGDALAVLLGRPGDTP